MEFEIKYADRLLTELSEIKARQETYLISRTSSAGLEAAFKGVKQMCMDEVLKIKENNDVLAKYVENFSNKILKLISDLEENEHTEILKIQSKIDLLDEILASTHQKKNDLSAREKPEGRTGRKIRAIGERPEKLKDIRNRETSESK